MEAAFGSIIRIETRVSLCLLRTGRIRIPRDDIRWLGTYQPSPRGLPWIHEWQKSRLKIRKFQLDIQRALNSRSGLISPGYEFLMRWMEWSWWRRAQGGIWNWWLLLFYWWANKGCEAEVAQQKAQRFENDPLHCPVDCLLPWHKTLHNPRSLSEWGLYSFYAVI